MVCVWELMREKIIKRAEERFFKDGYRKVTMDEIASDLGISKKTLYKYFSGKESIAEAVIEKMHLHIVSFLEEFNKNIHDPVERFEQVTLAASRKLSEIGNLFLDDIKRDLPNLWQELEEFREQKILHHIGGILEEGKRLGLIRTDIDTKVATLVYLGAIKTVMQPDVLKKAGFSIDDAFANIRTIFLKGVRAG